MQRGFRYFSLRLTAIAVAALFLSLPVPDAVAQGKRLVTVINNSSTEAQVRMKLWQRDFTRLSVGRSQQFEVPAEFNTVQVEAKSRKQGDNCWSNVQVGGTLEIIDGNQQILCRPR